DWQATLEQDLVRLAYYPQHSEPGATAPSVWPGSATLVRAREATLNDQPRPADSELERAWQEVGALTNELSTLQAIWKLLGRAGSQRRAAHPDDTALRRRLTVFLDQVALEMVRAQRVADLAERTYLDNLLQSNYRVGALLAEELDTTQQLAWLSEVGVRWGCLGLWT